MEISGLKDDYHVWVSFMDAEVFMRYVSIDELRQILKKATKTSWDRKHQKADELDPVEANRLLGRACVRDWKGITMEGKEYPYSPENCDFLMSKWMEFSRFVNETCTDLQALQDAEKERKTKNSLLTSGQDETIRV
ncbi:MAG: hypothetical protein HY805_00335 [Nitrospirae bacterium]|nr:hypothetical protein [Nitrospirota bacterium]